MKRRAFVGRLLLAPLAVAVAPAPAVARAVAGLDIPDGVSVAGQSLVLNGAGVRYRSVFKVYVGALYLPQPTHSAREALAMPGAKRFSMTMLRDITAQQLIDGLIDGIEDNHPPAEVEKYRPRMDRFAAVMAGVGRAPTGSVMTIDHLPGAGTQPAIDGRLQGEPIPGDDFYMALLRIWLNDSRPDRLQKQLLGQH